MPTIVLKRFKVKKLLHIYHPLPIDIEPGAIIQAADIGNIIFTVPEETPTIAKMQNRRLVVTDRAVMEEYLEELSPDHDEKGVRINNPNATADDPCNGCPDSGTDKCGPGKCTFEG